MADSRVRREALTVERVRELLDYDSETGDFKRKLPIGGCFAGEVAGWINSRGYLLIRVDGEIYSGHRLAWFVTFGKWPTTYIDHIDRDKSNNRIINLRLATRSQNSANTGPRSSNTSGFKGVYWYHNYNKWRAQIRVKGRRKHIGYFDTAEDAAKAYQAEAKLLFGEFVTG